MKKTIINTMFTTGAALVILAAFFVIFGLKNMSVLTIFQVFGANIVINFGLFLIQRKFESRYVIIEYLLDISYIIVILIVSGAVFGWYSFVPIWILPLMAVLIYIFVIITSMAKIKKDTKEINKLLQKRKEKQTDIE